MTEEFQNAEQQCTISEQDQEKTDVLKQSSTLQRNDENHVEIPSKGVHVDEDVDNMNMHDLKSYNSHS